jgi:uncharacterized protein YozE (UPF0346 family)
MSNYPNDHYMIAIDAADDAGMWPVNRLKAVTVAADATVLVKFEPGAGGTADGDHDVVTLTCTADKEKDVMIGIADAINQATKYPKSAKNYTVLCDDVNSVFAHANILSCTITLAS